jgi:hypothetical protein
MQFRTSFVVAVAVCAVLTAATKARADDDNQSACGAVLKDDGELTLLRFSARYEQFLREFSGSTADVLAKAASFDEAHDQLLGELATAIRRSQRPQPRAVVP